MVIPVRLHSVISPVFFIYNKNELSMLSAALLYFFQISMVFNSFSFVSTSNPIIAS